MSHPRLPVALFALALAAGTAADAASYRYGGFGGEAQGFVVLLEGQSITPSNIDATIATAEGGQHVAPITVDWDDVFGGRFGLGYQWANGNRLSVTAWGLSTSESTSGAAAPGTRLFFAIGPPIPDGSGGYLGQVGAPGTYSMEAEIEAGTVDLTWGRSHELTEGFGLEWTLGFRYASYEESLGGAYDQIAGFDPGSGPMAASRTIDSEMYGALASLRADYGFSANGYIASSLGFSFLQGTTAWYSGISPQGTVGGIPTGTNEFSVNDDGRTGGITTFDLVVGWRTTRDTMRVYLGWEQQRWQDLAADATRNFPGTGAPVPDRDDVAFSGWKLGARFVF